MRATSRATRQSPFTRQLNLITRVPHPDEGKNTSTLPQVVAIGATAAPDDICDLSLELLDQVAEYEPVRDLLADRLYSNWKWPRWGQQLKGRKIRQHLDITKNDQGFRDYNGALLTAGTLHCPATPRDLGTIHKPAPNDPDPKWDEFAEQIEIRESFAFDRVAGPDADGNQRWTCPAQVGKRGCPHVEGTVPVALTMGLPIVQKPPEILRADDGTVTPLCCTQRTVSTGEDAQVKLAQQKYWGSKDWLRRHSRRTYVEGVFGNIKDPSTEGVSRGKFRLRGLGAHLLFLAFAAAAYNIRIGRKRLAQDGWPDTDNPLYQQDPEYNGFGHLTREQAIAIDSVAAGDGGRALETGGATPTGADGPNKIDAARPRKAA